LWHTGGHPDEFMAVGRKKRGHRVRRSRGGRSHLIWVMTRLSISGNGMLPDRRARQVQGSAADNPRYLHGKASAPASEWRELGNQELDGPAARPALAAAAPVRWRSAGAAVERNDG